MSTVQSSENFEKKRIAYEAYAEAVKALAKTDDPRAVIDERRLTQQMETIRREMVQARSEMHTEVRHAAKR
jgi:hypothetical protein